MNVAEARERFAASPVARLATTSADGHPHLVPVTFALVGAHRLVSAVDHKPKRTTALKRLANIAANPSVCMLVDHYEEDWSRLWWARADGAASLIEPGAARAEREAALAALAKRYPAYREHPPEGTLIFIDVERWSGWRAAEGASGSSQ